MQRLLFLFAFLSFLAACTVTKVLPEVNYLKPYDREAHYIHPEIGVYNDSKDSSLLIIRLRCEELLQSRPNPDEPFSWNLGFEARVRTASDSLVSSEKWNLAETVENQTELTIEQRIAIPQGDDLHLYVVIIDLVRNVKEKQLLRLDKGSRTNKHSFLVRDGDQRIVLSNTLLPQTSYTVSCADCKDIPMRVYQSEKSVSLPPPPHSGNSRGLPNMEETSYQNIAFSPSATVILRDEWLSLRPINSDDGSGIFLRQQAKAYPFIEHYATMSEAIRYIATRKEYTRVMDSSDKHEAMDNFWLDCAGNKDRAKAMIKMYYKRVEEANTYFADYNDGWKTDRGLVHVIYGNPTRVYRKQFEEVWVYGAADEPSAPVFRFQRMYSNLVGHYYELERSSNYKPDWDALIQAWKNGRIYTG